MSGCLVRRNILRSSVGMRSSWSARQARTLRDVGRELGVDLETPRTWVSAAKRAEGAGSGGDGRGEPVSPGEREELRRLWKQVAELELLRGVAKYLPRRWGR